MNARSSRDALGACFVSLVALTAASTTSAQKAEGDKAPAAAGQKASEKGRDRAAGRAASKGEAKDQQTTRDKWGNAERSGASNERSGQPPRHAERRADPAKSRNEGAARTTPEPAGSRDAGAEGARSANTPKDTSRDVGSRTPDGRRAEPKPEDRRAEPQPARPTEKRVGEAEGRNSERRSRDRGDPSQGQNDRREADRRRRDGTRRTGDRRDNGRPATVTGSDDREGQSPRESAREGAREGDGRDRRDIGNLFARPDRGRDGPRGDRARERGDLDLSAIRKRRETRRDNDGRLEVIIEPGDRRIIRDGNRAYIRSDDGHRFRRFGDRRVERRGDREVVIFERPNGVRIISVYDRHGRLVERRRRWRGRETVLIDNSRAVGAGVALGIGIGGLIVGLSEPRIDIPRRRYIVEYDDASEDDIYTALTAPPLERLERGYALDEVKYSPNLRARTRRVDLNAVNFESGSWELTEGQQAKFERLAKAMRRAIEKNPNEIFLIEGHTDAVGSEIDNLTLSDRRAETVAELLTEEYGIPPENLVTQGYGEQQLKVETEAAEAANRRVAVRRITPLLARSS